MVVVIFVFLLLPYSIIVVTTARQDDFIVLYYYVAVMSFPLAGCYLAAGQFLFSVLKKSFPLFFKIIRPGLYTINTIIIATLVLRGIINLFLATDAFAVNSYF